MTRNHYSRLWFSTFLGDIDSDIVAPEVAFVERQFPVNRFPKMLDLCCGPGRHLAPLAASGYQMMGLDLDADALSSARTGTKAVANSCFVRGDMKALPVRDGCLDAVICMWQSFGHFDDYTNREVLADMARALRRNGCVLLDVYHREYYRRTQGERQLERYGLRVSEKRWMDGKRLRVTLRYVHQVADDKPAGVDEFDWRLYTPDELTLLAKSVGLVPRLTCTRFDESVAPSSDSSRMQLVFVRGSRSS